MLLSDIKYPYRTGYVDGVTVAGYRNSFNQETDRMLYDDGYEHGATVVNKVGIYTDPTTVDMLV